MKTNQAILAAVIVAAAIHSTQAESSFLEGIRRHKTLASTVADNGDLNPYAVFVAPVSSGKIQKDDVLVDNFNGIANLQGTGVTIMNYRPFTQKMTVFATLPKQIPGCPGGVGLSTAMVMLKAGWVIVGSTPSTDGTTRTKGDGALLVLDSQGQLATAWSGTNINYPWGNMAVIDNITNAVLFVSMAGFDVPGPGVLDPKTGLPVVINKAKVLRLEVDIPQGQPPVITGQTIIADGFGQRADRSAFLVGPTGLVIGTNDTLFLSDALGNRIVAIDNASTRTSSAGTGREITKNGLLKRPLAMIMAPNGNLIVSNAKNGQAVEIDPTTGTQLCAQWLNANPAQSPPGNGNLFGIALAPDGKGLYYVSDDVNTLVEAIR